MTSRPALFVLALAGVLFATPAFAAGEAEAPMRGDWSFSGIFGTFDRAQLRRGHQVYREVCAACHGMKYVYFRNLVQPGGPEMDEAAVKALAESFDYLDGPDSEGEMFDRPGRLADAFPEPFANKEAARASNNGAFPPDLSLIVKARGGGADYLYSLMQGYKEESPEGVELADGQYYNSYFPGHVLAMAPPLSEDIVEYADGTPASVEQMSADVAAFLAWASEPSMEERKKLGFQVLAYLGFLALLLFFSTRKIWADKHKEEG